MTHPDILIVARDDYVRFWGEKKEYVDTVFTLMVMLLARYYTELPPQDSPEALQLLSELEQLRILACPDS